MADAVRPIAMADNGRKMSVGRRLADVDDVAQFCSKDRRRHVLLHGRLLGGKHCPSESMRCTRHQIEFLQFAPRSHIPCPQTDAACALGPEAGGVEVLDVVEILLDAPRCSAYNSAEYQPGHHTTRLEPSLKAQILFWPSTLVALLQQTSL